jgi:tol-pal system protein YbgF
MTMSRAIAAAALAVVVLAPGVASADADKEHKLIMAEIRMLQEEQQQVRQVLAGLNETLKAINARMDADAARYQKMFADQKLAVDGIAETTRVLREKADETTVRLSTMSQEVQSLRQAMSSMSAPAPVTPAIDPAATDPSATAPSSAGANPPPPNLSPTQLWDRVYALYTAGQFDLAIEGFQSYIRAFPTSPRAAEAQAYIGHSYYSAGKYSDAATALQRVISNYPQSESVPEAYYKLGLTYEAMKQLEQARRVFETVIKNHSNTQFATLAQQALVRVRDKKEE